MRVIKMNDQKMLSQVLHTVQMGQSGIRCVMDDAVSPALKKEMKQQLQNYDAMENAALRLAARKGWQLHDVSPGVQKMADMMAKMRLIGGQRDAKIAGMLIQGNTRGVILGTKNLHHSPNADPEIRALTQQLVQQEKAAMANSEKYL